MRAAFCLAAIAECFIRRGGTWLLTRNVTRPMPSRGKNSFAFYRAASCEIAWQEETVESGLCTARPATVETTLIAPIDSARANATTEKRE